MSFLSKAVDLDDDYDMIEMTNKPKTKESSDPIIHNIVNNMFKKIKLTEPLNKYYNNIEEYFLNGYQIYENSLNRLPKIYDIMDNDKYYKFNEYPHPKYSTSTIPVYFRQIKELENMFSPFYYNTFKFEYFDSINYNPQLYNFEYHNNNIIIPTITPVTNNLICVNLNYNTYDFFSNKGLLIDMYNTYKNLAHYDKTFLVYNSLELGSLPEIYHYHIQKAIIQKPTFVKILDGLYEAHASTFANVYCIKISEIELENFYDNFGAFIYNCRKVLFKGMYYKYSAQIYFYNFDDEDYLLFSFRKTSVKNIVVKNNKLSQAYWDDIYGSSFEKYGIIYLPIGIVICNNSLSDITENMIKDMKKPFVPHPLIKKKYEKYMFKKTEIKYYQNIVACSNIGRDIDNAIKNDTIANIKCNMLPYLYKDGDTGLLHIGGNKFYVTKFSELANKYINFETKYIYPIIYAQFIYKNEKYMLFQEIMSNLKVYINFENNNLINDNNIINLFMLSVLNSLLVLKKKHNIVYYIESLDDLYVCSELRGLIDYDINGIKVTVSNTDNSLKIKHYGKNILFTFKEIKYNKSIEDSYKNFITLLDNYLNSKNIYNPTIKKILHTLNNTHYNILECMNHFKYASDMYAFRPPYYSNYIFYKKYIENEPYENLVQRVLNSPDLNIDNNLITVQDVKEGEYYVSGVNNSQNDSMEAFSENKFYTNQITYLAHIKELDNSKYIGLLESLYMKTTTYSRLMIFKTKGGKILYINNDNDSIFNKKSFSEIQFSVISSFLPGLTRDKIKEFNEKYFKKTVINEEIIQNLFNFYLQIKYPQYDAYSSFNTTDRMREIITLNITNYVNLVAILKLTNLGFLIFNNITIFNNWIKNEIYNNKFFNSINMPKYISSNFSFNGSTYAFIKYKDIIIDYLNNLNKKYDVLTSPIQPNIYDFIEF